MKGSFNDHFFWGGIQLVANVWYFSGISLKKGGMQLGLWIYPTEFSPTGGQHLSNGVHYQLGPWRRRFGFPLILGHVFYHKKLGISVLFWGFFSVVWRNPLFGFCGRFSGALFFLLDFWFHWFSPKTLVYRFQSKKVLSPPCLPLKNPLLLRGMCLGESGGISTCGNDQSQKHLLDHFPVLVPLGKKNAPG